MALSIVALPRVFHYNGTELPDPNPTLTAEKVRELYVARFPELSTAAVNGPEARNKKMIYTFVRSVGAKG